MLFKVLTSFGIKLNTTQLLSSDWESFERNGLDIFNTPFPIIFKQLSTYPLIVNTFLMAFKPDGYLCKILWLQKNCIDSFLVHRPMQGKISYAWAKRSFIFEKFQNTFLLIYSGLLYQILESRSKSVQYKLCTCPGSKQQQHKGLEMF